MEGILWSLYSSGDLLEQWRLARTVCFFLFSIPRDGRTNFSVSEGQIPRESRRSHFPTPAPTVRFSRTVQRFNASGSWTLYSPTCSSILHFHRLIGSPFFDWRWRLDTVWGHPPRTFSCWSQYERLQCSRIPKEETLFYFVLICSICRVKDDYADFDVYYGKSFQRLKWLFWVVTERITMD